MTFPIKHILFISILTFLLAGCGSSSDKPGTDHGLIEHSTETVKITITGDQNNTGGSENTAATLKTLTLSVDVASLNKERNTTLKAEALYTDNSTKDLTTRVQWIITPPDAVKISGHTLTALRDVNVTIQAKAGSKTSNPVKLSIYWEVNGHRLPPEPDPKINNATLLGVDVNHNGVRDDVERKVYATYKKAIERAVMMQAFRTEQAMLADPDLVKNAREWEKKVWKAYSCKNYLADNNKMKYIKSTKLSKNIENWQFNTEKRVKKYFQYDQALSGGVYSIKDGTLQDCEFDVEKVLEMDK